ALCVGIAVESCARIPSAGGCPAIRTQDRRSVFSSRKAPKHGARDGKRSGSWPNHAVTAPSDPNDPVIAGIYAKGVRNASHCPWCLTGDFQNCQELVRRQVYHLAADRNRPRRFSL